MNPVRIVKHLLIPDWWAQRAFSKSIFDRVNAAVLESEKLHRGELRFVVEGDLHLLALLRGMTPRERAEELFAQMRVWDTEENSGVLIYVQLVDHCIEIVADRGISAKVGQSEWGVICGTMEAAFRAGRFAEGALEAINAITDLLSRHFPARRDNPNELPDRPVRL